VSVRKTADPLVRRAAFRSALCRWFARNGLDYPWRRTRDPHAILVAEVMLQQTRIATVLGKGYYTRFLSRFPDPATLAQADDASLLRAWEGLGYYRRARLLRETARAVVTHHDGRFPADPAALLALPGIGRYTAGAVLSFAFGIPAPLVDGNVARVLARLLDFRQPVDSPAGARQLWQWAAELVDPNDPRAYNSALMELGQTVCRNGTPACDRCPVARFCQASAPADLPVRKPRAAVTDLTEHALFARRGDGAVLLQQARGRREGLWQLPVRAAGLSRLPLAATVRYSITRYRVTLHVHVVDPARVPAGPPELVEVWHPAASLPHLPMSAPFRRALQSLLAKPALDGHPRRRRPASPPIAP
jgi:A/G-specific adenine glycosylase